MTFLDFFEEHVKKRPHDNFLGTRRILNDHLDSQKTPQYGEYEWMSYECTQRMAQLIA